MAERITSVVNDALVAGESTYSVRVPRGSREVQVVIDRTKFEQLQRTTRSLCQVEVWNKKSYLGGFSFGDFRVDETSAQRPGQRMLWSFGRWPLDNASTIEIKIIAKKDFYCLLDVDFF